MPTLALLPILITFGALALVLMWPRVRSGPSIARLAVELVVVWLLLVAFVVGLLVAAQRLPL